MLGKLYSLFHERRISQEPVGEDRRHPTPRQANERLQKAAESLNETITLWPNQAKDLLEKVKQLQQENGDEQKRR
jgi:hypothetical protein